MKKFILKNIGKILIFITLGFIIFMGFESKSTPDMTPSYNKNVLATSNPIYTTTPSSTNGVSTIMESNSTTSNNNNTLVKKFTPLNDNTNNFKNQATIIISVPIKNKIILASSSFSLENGETAFSLLLKATKSNNIQMEYSGSITNAYVKGINNIYEFDEGPKSGWLFKVNGQYASISAGNYKLNSNDHVEWIYTTELIKVIN